MDSADVIESITALADTAFTALGLFLTILSGYLVVAYIIGSQLSRAQVTFINTLFVIFSIVTSLGTLGYFTFQALVIEIFGENLAGPTIVLHVFNFLVFLIQVAAIVGALVFMRSIRKTASNDA